MFAIGKDTMQYFTLLLLVSSVVIAESTMTQEDLKAATMAMRKCKSTGDGFDPTVFISKVLDGEMVNDRNFDCFVACFIDEIHFFNDDGSINVNKALDKVPDNIPNRDLIIDAIKSCGELRDKDKCSTAHMLFQCGLEKKIPSLLLGS